MSENTVTPVESADSDASALSVLKSAADLIRSNGRNRYKGVTKELREQWTFGVNKLFNSPQCNVELIWDDLALLPNEVVADGVTSAWENLSSEQRQVLQRRLKFLGPEKEASQRFLFIMKLLDKAPLDALRFYSDIAPKHTDTLKQAAGTFLALNFQKMQRLFPPEAELDLLSKAINKSVILLEHSSIGSTPRWAFSKAILCTLSDRQLLSRPEFLDSVKRLASIAATLPTTSQEDLRPLFGNMWPGDESQIQADPAGSSKAPTGSAQNQQPKQALDLSTDVQASPPKVIQTAPSVLTAASADPNLFASEWREMLKRQVELLDRFLSVDKPGELDALRSELVRARKGESQAILRANEARQSADVAEAEVVQMAEQYRLWRQRFEDLSVRMQELEPELQKARQERDSLRSEIQTSKTKHAQDVEDLSHRIAANAELRLNEFRKRIGNDLMRLLSDTPERSAPVDANLGSVLLTRIHQIMDKLEKESVQVRSRGKSI